MGSFTNALGLHRLVSLFTKSRTTKIRPSWQFPSSTEHNNKAGALMKHRSPIITALLKSYAQPADTVLSTHNVTVTTRCRCEILPPVIKANDPFDDRDERLSLDKHPDTAAHEQSEQVSCDRHHTAAKDQFDVISRDRTSDSNSQPEPSHTTEVDPAAMNEEHVDENLFEDDQKEHCSNSASSSSSSTGTDKDAVDPEVLRADWAPIRSIPQHSFHQALLQHLPDNHDTILDELITTDEIEGGFNYVRIIEVPDGPQADRYVIKVPCTGTASRWQEADAYMFRNEAQTMSYIYKHTAVPIPEVLGFSDTLSNVLGAPYIVMRAAGGVPSNRIWFDRDEDGDDDITNAYLPSDRRMRMRTTFLQSLAHAMSKLQTLSFDQAGMLNFDENLKHPNIGPVHHWKTISELTKLTKKDLSTPACLTCVPPFSTSEAYFMTALNSKFPREEGDSYTTLQHNGRRHIMEVMLANEPFYASNKTGEDQETFVLRHDDLDFQNILCDPSGGVTAILDWDKCRVVPRCFGFASLPNFLICDWCPEYSGYRDTHMPWELDEYRRIYATAMLEATGPHGDWKYTLKSPIYQAVHAALYGSSNGGSVKDVVSRILKELPSTRRFVENILLEHIAEGWEQGEWKVNTELVRLIAPDALEG